MPNALEALLNRIQHLLHFGQDPVVVVEPDNADRGLLLNRLLDKLPDTLDVALLRYKKSPGIRKLRTDILSQWFSDPVINPDDTLADSYLRLSQQKANRLLVVDASTAVEAEIFRELLRLSQLTEDSIGLLVLAPNVAVVPKLDWQPIMLGSVNNTDMSPEVTSVKSRKPTLIIVAAAVVLAVVLFGAVYVFSPDNKPPQSQSVKLNLGDDTQPVGGFNVSPQPVANTLSDGSAPKQEDAKNTTAAPVSNEPSVPEMRKFIIHESDTPAPTGESTAVNSSTGGPASPAKKATTEPVASKTEPTSAQSTAKVEVKPVATKAAAEKAAPKPDVKPVSSWPDNVPDSHYALQLIAGQNAQKIEQAMAGQEVGNWYMVKTRRSGKVFYLVVQGNYASLAQANAAKATLPKRFRDAGAWPKRYDKIKAAIAAGKG
ncbi:SPOR domain-containing protein [Gallaecimonas mangrovi]|uniref:SPOR domain-containing protein n=1 Tax=Gallaecimonas mangrovi TaxID=2291597 RepID=UPI000E1FC289|nr:hypothetical protein [Gallaecimonas mangrovi]